jgi:dissimilatory sulfite reductase (desulfoviridin) alpha/beta subunit
MSRHNADAGVAGARYAEPVDDKCPACGKEVRPFNLKVDHVENIKLRRETVVCQNPNCVADLERRTPAEDWQPA